MEACPLRLPPGADLRAALTTIFGSSGAKAAFVLQAIGSLQLVRLRFAGRDAVTELFGDYEILTLAGTLSADGPHLHMSVADRNGTVTGGHVSDGCIVRTTVEVLVSILPGHRFSRIEDEATGYLELRVDDIAGQD